MAEVTLPPFQTKWPVFTAEATRSEAVINVHVLFVLLSKRKSSQMLGNPPICAPLWPLVKVRKPSPCANSWVTTVMRSASPPWLSSSPR